MNPIKSILGASLLAVAIAASPASAHPPIAAEQAAASFEADRADILAMAGNYKVRFDMQESTRWDPAYTPLHRRYRAGTRSFA